MLKFLIAAAALSIAPSAVAQQVVKTVVIDNRGLCSDAGSRIAEGDRRRANIKASRIIADLKAQGVKVNVIRLEDFGDAGFRTVEGDVLVRIDNGAC